MALATPVHSTTRDTLERECVWEDKTFTLVDTAGLLEKPLSSIEKKAQEHSHAMLMKADVLVFMLDGKGDATQEDFLILKLIRTSGRPYVPVINKIDPGSNLQPFCEYARLGIDDPLIISALHNVHIDQLMDRIDAIVPLPASAPESSSHAIRVGIVGTPNAGKTSLLNNLLPKHTQGIIDQTRGTTRDFLEKPAEIDGNPIVFVDTPGLSKGRKKSNLIDHLMTKRTRLLLNEIDLCLLVIDASKPMHAADQKISILLKDASCGCIVVLNKWDIVPEREKAFSYWKKTLAQKLRYLEWAPYVTISALKGTRLHSLKDLLIHVLKLYNHPVDHDELMRRWKAFTRSKKIFHHGRRIVFHSIVQKEGFPPCFEIKTSIPHLVHFSIQRHLESWLREQFNFVGVPIKLVFSK